MLSRKQCGQKAFRWKESSTSAHAFQSACVRNSSTAAVLLGVIIYVSRELSAISMLKEHLHVPGPSACSTETLLIATSAALRGVGPEVSGAVGGAEGC